MIQLCSRLEIASSLFDTQPLSLLLSFELTVFQHILNLNGVQLMEEGTRQPYTTVTPMHYAPTYVGRDQEIRSS